MANKKISELTTFTTALGTDQIPVNRSGMNGKLALSSLSSLSTTHYIGEFFGGGVVFHVYKDSLGVEHGLIVSIVNLANAQYSNIVNLVSSATSTWNGQGNTNLLKAQSGATSGAWKLCDDYSNGGFTDWYLPSVDEWNLLWNNRFNVNKTLTNIVGAAQIGYDTYWSSSEGNIVSAYVFYANLGSASSLSKSTAYSVRAIRQF